MYYLIGIKGTGMSTLSQILSDLAEDAGKRIQDDDQLCACACDHGIIQSSGQL